MHRAPKERLSPDRASQEQPPRHGCDPRSLSDEDLLACVAELGRREQELLERARKLRQARAAAEAA